MTEVCALGVPSSFLLSHYKGAGGFLVKFWHGTNCLQPVNNLIIISSNLALSYFNLFEVPAKFISLCHSVMMFHVSSCWHPNATWAEKFSKILKADY